MVNCSCLWRNVNMHIQCLWFLQNHTICHTFISLYLMTMILFHILPLTSPLLASFSVPACTMSQQHAHTHIHALSSHNCCPFPPVCEITRQQSLTHSRCCTRSLHCSEPAFYFRRRETEEGRGERNGWGRLSQECKWWEEGAVEREGRRWCENWNTICLNRPTSTSLTCVCAHP